LLCISVADPGVVQTNIMREVPASLSWVAFFVLKRLRLLESSECGNDSIIDAALVPPVSTFLAAFVDIYFTFLLHTLMFQND